MKTTIDDPRAVLTVCFVTAIGALFFNVQPVLLGAFADTFGFDESQLGGIAATGLLAAFAVIVSAFHWVPRVSWRRGMAAGLTGVTLACLCLSQTGSYPGVLLAVALMGAGMAAAYGPALAALATARDPVRAFGLAIVMQASLAALSVLLIPAWLLPVLGFPGLTGYIALVSGLGLVLLPLAPARSSSPPVNADADADPPQPGIHSRGAGLAWLGLAAMAVYFLGLNGTWAFLGRIGSGAGLSGQATGLALSASMVVGAAGAGAASALSTRISLPAAMGTCVVLFVTFVALMSDAPGAWTFGVALVLFNMAWNFSMPFQMEVVSRADGSGRFIVLVPAAQTVGGAAGPALAGPLLAASGAGALYVQLLICVAVACAAYVVLNRRLSIWDGS